MKLPTKKKKINDNALSYTVLLYGYTKIGKTTFVSKAPGALFLCTEPGTEALEVFEIQISTWREFLEACKLLEAAIGDGKCIYDCVCIDTIDNLFAACQAHVCKGLNIRHPSDAEYGAGWDAIKQEFKRVLLKLARMPLGLWLLSHAKTRKVKVKGGDEYDRITPTLPNSAREIVLGLSDMVLFADFEQTGNGQATRVIRTKPTVAYDAGDRTGKLPSMVPLDYHMFMAAFGAAIRQRPESR